LDDKCIVTLMSNNVRRFLKFRAISDTGFYYWSFISFRNKPNLKKNLRNIFLFYFSSDGALASSYPVCCLIVQFNFHSLLLPHFLFCIAWTSFMGKSTQTVRKHIVARNWNVIGKNQNKKKSVSYFWVLSADHVCNQRDIVCTNAFLWRRLWTLIFHLMQETYTVRAALG
jgi:hypothetical protein